jgi:hypothetical protein
LNEPGSVKVRTARGPSRPVSAGERKVDTTLGLALSRARMSDAELSRRSGVARSRVNLIKNGRVTATLRESLVFARLLGRDVRELFRLGTA